MVLQVILMSVLRMWMIVQTMQRAPTSLGATLVPATLDLLAMDTAALVSILLL